MSDCIDGRSSEAPRPPQIAQKMMIVRRSWATVIASAPMAYPRSPITYAFLRPIRSPILLLMRMNAAETSASSAIADWTPLTVVPRSWTTAEIDTFISDVSTTRTNIAAASRSPRRMLIGASVSDVCAVTVAIGSSGVRAWPQGYQPTHMRDVRNDFGDGAGGGRGSQADTGHTFWRWWHGRRPG